MFKGIAAIEYLKSKGYRILARNIIYVEGMNIDGSLNPDKPYIFNDIRSIVGNDGKVYGIWQATTEPGRYYTEKPMNPKGAARIAFGNYQDTWAIGKHFSQDALVQVKPVKVHRDLNKDSFRTNDKVDTGLFGINQHTTVGSPTEIGKWSAGCLVGRLPSEHKVFMALCRSMGRKTFDTTIIDGTDFVKFCKAKGL